MMDVELALGVSNRCSYVNSHVEKNTVTFLGRKHVEVLVRSSKINKKKGKKLPVNEIHASLVAATMIRVIALTRLVQIVLIVECLIH